jgi:hypothetical protein
MTPQVLLGSTRSRDLLRRMRELGWGRLFANEIPKPLDGEPWALDNGVFPAWKAGVEWDEQPFLTGLHAIERRIACGRMQMPLFTVLPDRVADSESLRFSLDWYERKGRYFEVPWYLVLQNGFRPDDVRAAMRNIPIAGLFLGGDDDFKLTAPMWCELAHAESARFHFARVSTVGRLEIAYAIGADSCDTTQPLWSEEAFDRFASAVERLSERRLPPLAVHGDHS